MKTPACNHTRAWFDAWVRPLFCFAAALIWLTGASRCSAEVSREYQLKAAFLFNFVQFTKWPPDAFVSANAPITIGILGEDPFETALDEIIRGETIGDRPIVVQRGKRVEELERCHVIFISQSEKSKVADIVSRIGNKPILTVSSLDGFARRGGVIGFFLEGNKVRFEINPSRAASCGLKLSSQLLGVAKIVSTNAAKEGG